MKRAIFMWDYDTCYEALGEIELGDKAPMGVEGRDLILDGIFKDDDGKNWEKMMGMCAQLFFEDQGYADVPYLPPDDAKKHAVYMMSAEEVEKTFKDLGVKDAKDGKELMSKYNDQPEKVQAKVQSEGVEFMKDWLFFFVFWFGGSIFETHRFFSNLVLFLAFVTQDMAGQHNNGIKLKNMKWSVTTFHMDVL